ncbi:MAG: uncharacterized protein QOI98_1077, partial [Solirubrobacteraceae bacterium]|nr:uncharacterized protein [Solirubrobacteraceae bacterium]
MIPAWLAALVAELPDLDYFDAHTHIGENDPDGSRSSPEELLASLEPLHARAVVFPMHEPDGYPPANDRVLAEAAASDGRLVPFCRLDPHADPLAEAARCVAAGARGIKLHPRAEQFALDEPVVSEIFAFADERRLPVLIHAGRGIPALGVLTLEHARAFPNARVILAHAAICDLSWIWKVMPDHPNVFIDTSWWIPADLLALFALVAPGQILLASDAPYGPPALGAVLGLRCALHAGLSEAQLRSVAGGQVQRLIAGDDPLDVGPAPGADAVGRDLLLDRIAFYLVFAIGRLLGGGPGEEGVALA